MPPQHPNPHPSRDTQDVIDAIAAETRAFVAADFDAWAQCWVQNPHTVDVYASKVSGLTVLRGWQAVQDNMRHVFANDLGCDLAEFHQENHQVQIMGDQAWVVFDAWSRDSSGAAESNFETRILQRQEGGWKIAYAAVIQQHDAGALDTEIAVDGQGYVVYTSDACRVQLQTHALLTISANRLRARRLDWDKILQAELAKAGAHHGYFALRRFHAQTGAPLQYPVILGQKDDGGVAIVLLSVRDQATYVLLVENAHVDRRLAVARAVFGLSDTQFAVAKRIALGYSIPDLAGQLGITTNTARTHLTRLYQKTGVHTQTALVRLLLSVG